jgi:tRNA(Leu) C34 or U34 (ribose-2'-O)-methylase TrmL
MKDKSVEEKGPSCGSKCPELPYGVFTQLIMNPVLYGKMKRVRLFCTDINDALHSFYQLSNGGVGPWPSNLAWPTDPKYDLQLLKNGDSRNVADRYRYWKMEAIIKDLDTRRHPFHVAIENWKHDSNIGNIVRTANAFAAAKIHIVGRRNWNRRGAMVTDKYQHLEYHSDVYRLQEWAGERKLAIIGIDNIPGANSIADSKIPKECVLLFGQESTGLSASAKTIVQDCFYIPQFGSTRSINAGVAAGIAMYHWIYLHANLSIGNVN